MPYIILDRDGVINYDSEEYIKSPDEWQPIPGSLEAIARLNKAGYRVLIVTNQSGIARGLYDVAMLHKIHEKLTQELSAVGGAIEAIFFCPHHPDDNCLCRKPNTGLIKQIASRYALHLPDTFFIGDSYGDMKAAINAQCRPLLVLTGNGNDTLQRFPEFNHVPNFIDLTQAVEYVITITKK